MQRVFVQALASYQSWAIFVDIFQCKNAFSCWFIQVTSANAILMASASEREKNASMTLDCSSPFQGDGKEEGGLLAELLFVT